MQNKNSGQLAGIDISAWQGEIDFLKVKESGVDIVYIKATEGDYYTDAKLKIYYEGAKKHGLLVGFYHFFRPINKKNALSQAQYFVSVISELRPDCKLALDIEITEGLDKNYLSILAEIFLREVKRLSGVDVILYTYTYFAKTKLEKSLSIYPLWIAEYGVDTPKENGIWDSWVGFQYTDSALVSGVNGNCDKNSFTKEILLDTHAIISKIKKPQPTNPPDKYITHVVKPGENLIGIAKKYGTNYALLASINGLVDTNFLKKGQLLKIPVWLSKPSVDETYIVKKGDTLTSIASRFVTTVQKLIKANNIKDANVIKIGQILKI
ncbi:GH25 family lysozyme [Clostridium tarantellae]|uniref:Lysozyme n=1 Tax=Clostridium tarantellae TaxID=39493 RepID=A0A6I1MIR6_9CLOT|nr:GH25 family lysozyme [Clostridium tarantellae]MPQ43265.1 LysM peptidoglycan-binding domain-containing protein [Clostridium tarantellae]